jgi:acyl carrier protein phosphodiesterase
MNYLAHIYLSGKNDFIKIGNFMADGIRGKSFEKYPEDVQKGIVLHREIDTYTDAHPIFRQTSQRFHANYHHYSGVIVDIVYDHFLAKNWELYSNENLEEFIQNFYNSLENNKIILSERTLGLMPYMIKQNWLLSYQTKAGIADILKQMDARTNNESLMRFSINELEANYETIETEFGLFFKDLTHHVQEFMSTRFG